MCRRRRRRGGRRGETSLRRVSIARAIGSRCVADVGDGSVFGVDEVDDLERGREIDVGRARVPALGQPGVDERHVTG